MGQKIMVAATQFNHRPGDKAYNLSIIEQLCEKAARNNVKIIAFPEMCITGYWHVRKLSRIEILKLAESAVSGYTSIRLKELSLKYKMIIGAGIIEKGEDGKLYNTYVVTQPDRETQYHRKLHCFISEHMSSGNSYTIIETSLGIKIGVLICWDNNLIENVRSTALLGADIILSPHQTGGCKSNNGHVLGEIDIKLWQDIKKNEGILKEEFQGIKGAKWIKRWLPSRAHDNGVFIIFSNGVGKDDDEIRTGNAMLLDCYGEIINESKAITTDIVFGEFDMELLAGSIGRNWIKGRRPELYGVLTAPQKESNDIRTLKATE